MWDYLVRGIDLLAMCLYSERPKNKFFSLLFGLLGLAFFVPSLSYGSGLLSLRSAHLNRYFSIKGEEVVSGNWGRHIAGVTQAIPTVATGDGSDSRKKKEKYDFAEIRAVWLNFQVLLRFSPRVPGTALDKRHEIQKVDSLPLWQLKASERYRHRHQLVKSKWKTTW